jgi:AcrR family transcriptional regulator
LATERVKQKYQKRQKELLDAAATVFSQKGYHGATTTDIADLLGITQGNLYYYFKSKDDALTQICNGGTEGYLARLRDVVESNQTWAEKLASAITTHIEPVTTIPSYVLTFQREKRYLTGDAKKSVYALIEEYNRLFQSILVGGTDAGEFRTGIDTKLHSLMIIDACNAAQTMMTRNPKLTVKNMAEMVASLFLDGLRR